MRVPLRAIFERAAVTNGFLRNLTARRARALAGLLARSGKTGDPFRIATRTVSSSLVVGMFALPTGVCLGVFVWPPFFALCAAPLVVYGYPAFALRDAAQARKEKTERELPFFAVLASVLGAAGLPLYSIMRSGIGEATFGAMGDEGLRLRRDVEVFGANPLDALEALAAEHPSRKFGDFILGYCSKVRSGGDVASYLSGESGDLLRELESAWARYAARVGTVGSLMVAVFGVVPLLLLVMGFFSPSLAVLGLGSFALIVVPSLTLALVVLAGRMQPAGSGRLRGRPYLASGAAVIAFVPGFVEAAPWLMAALPLFVFCLAYGGSVRTERKLMGEEEAALPRFLKDLLELRRLDYDLGRSIVMVSGQSSYGRGFDEVLRRVSARLRAGVPLEDTRPSARTAMGRIAFFVLGKMAQSGGGTVDTVFQLSHYTSRMIQIKTDSRAEVKPYLILSYITPLLLVTGVAFVGGIMSNFGGGGAVGVLAPARQALPELAQVADVLIVASAAGLGIVGAKISDLTAQNTLRASSNVAIAATALVAVPLLNIPALLH